MKMKRILAALLTLVLLLSGLMSVGGLTVFAEGEEETQETTGEDTASDGEDGAAAPFEPSVILNDPEDHSLDIPVNEETPVNPRPLLNSVLQKKMAEDIQEVLNYQPVSFDIVGAFMTNVDAYVGAGGLSLSGNEVGQLLSEGSALSERANLIGLTETRDDLVEIIDTGSNATGYIYVVDRDSLAFRVEDTQGEGVANALVTVNYTDGSGQRVTRAQYTTSGNLPGVCAFDKMKDVTYVTIDVEAEGFRGQMTIDKRISCGDIQYWQLEAGLEDDEYVRCVDLGGKDIFLEDTSIYLVDSGSRPLPMRVVITSTGTKTLPESITLKDLNSGREIATFTDYTSVETGSRVSRMFTLSGDWIKKGDLLRADDNLYFDFEEDHQILSHVHIDDAVMQPGAQDQVLPLGSKDEKKVPLKDIMGGTGVFNLTIKAFKLPVTVGFYPDGGFIILATLDIERYHDDFSSLFAETWNPKNRADGESIFEPFKEEFWRKADRFKNGHGQINDSKKISGATDKYWSFNLSFSLYCNGIYNKKTGQFDGAFGGIFDAVLSGGMTQYFLVTTPIFVPFYIGFDLSGNIKSSISVGFLWKDFADGINAVFFSDDAMLLQRYELIVGLEFYAGVGLKGACSIQVGGGGSLDIAFIDWPREKGETKDHNRFVVDSYAHVRVGGSIAFFNFTLYNKVFGPWPLVDTDPDKAAAATNTPVDLEVTDFTDTDFSATEEGGTLLFTNGEGENAVRCYKKEPAALTETPVNDIQTIRAMAEDTYGDSQVQIVSTKKTTALFRLASVDGKATIVYHKQDPVTGNFSEDYYALPCFMGWDAVEYDVAAATDGSNRFYIGYVVANTDVQDVKARSENTRVAGIIVDLDNDEVLSNSVECSMQDWGKYYFYNPRVAGSGNKIAVAYQKSRSYTALSDSRACLFGTDLKETDMGQGIIFTSGDIRPGEPSFFLQERMLTADYRLIVDGFQADGHTDANNARLRYYVNVAGYELGENEHYTSNWGYANGVNYAIIAGKLYFLEKYAREGDQYGFGMRFTEVENSEELVANHENVYEFVCNDDATTLCLVAATTHLDVNMETGENQVKGSTIRIYSLESINTSGVTNAAKLHGPYDIFLEDYEIGTFSAVFNRNTCQSKGLSLVYNDFPEAELLSNGKVAISADLYQWKQNLARGMVATALEPEDLFQYYDEYPIPILVSYRNIGYAIEGPIAFTFKDESGYELHELYQSPQGDWYDVGTQVVHNPGATYLGDTMTFELYVARSPWWEANQVHEINVEVAPDYRGDAPVSLTSPVFDNKLTLEGEQIVLGEHHYADLSITNIGGVQRPMNYIEVEAFYQDGTKGSEISYIDLHTVMTDPDKDHYSVLFDLQPYWDRADKDGILGVRFKLLDENKEPLTGETVTMAPKSLLESMVGIPADTADVNTGSGVRALIFLLAGLAGMAGIAMILVRTGKKKTACR